MRQGSGVNSIRGRKVEPSANGINPGYVAQLGNKVGNHITDRKHETSYTGEKMHDNGRGFMAPKNKSQSSDNSGSQGRY